jgi:Protein of unknown function (DUF1566)
MRKHMLMLGAVLITTMVTWMGWGTPQALAQRARVPQTGQTTCWRLGDGQISCDAPEGIGQDGDIQAGVAWPTPRFTDRRDGTVRDNLTGLVWLKNADCFGSTAWMQALTLANALHDTGTPDPLNDCSLVDGSVAGDWRLSNVKELLSLIDYGQFNPALPAGHPFLNVPATGDYWSSTTRMAPASFQSSPQHPLHRWGMKPT